MKRNTAQQKKSGNTLFNYFTKVKEPVQKESLSSLIERTSISREVHTPPQTHIRQTTTKTTEINHVSKTKQTVDLTNDSDDDLILIPSSQQDTATFDSSPFSSQSSNRSDFLYTEEMTNTSKYNKKGWSIQQKESGPQKSSQDPNIEYERPSSQKFDRIVLQKPRITPKARYDWLSNNDVKPYSSSQHHYSAKNEVKRFELPVTRILPSSPQYGTGKQNKRNRDDSSFESWMPPSKQKKTVHGIKKERATSSSSSWSTSSSASRSNQRRVLPTTPMSQLASRSQITTEYRPELSEEQQRVFDMVVHAHQSLFFTGSAGTGKSVLLRAIIDRLRSQYGSQLAVTASTGIAACNINGCTLHSFGGIGIGQDSADQLYHKVLNSKRAKERWIETTVLIIDEISMVDADLFDKLNIIAKRIRRNDKPFGGMQIVVTGDFFQLPPVNPNKVSKFAFEANAWQEAITQTVMLTQVFRQKDGTFVRILNEMRLGRLSNEAINIFSSLSRTPEGDNEIEPTELYPLRNEVDSSNKRRLDELKGETVEFKAVDVGDPRKISGCIAPAVMHLKLHAQVMLLKNIDSDLVNGSLGVVIGFVGKGEYRSKKKCEFLRTPQKLANYTMENELDMNVPYPIVKFSGERILLLERETWSFSLPGGNVEASRHQIPLMLAWAISIHKSQGQTLDRVRVDLGKVFEKGQAYVALSRATNLETLQILNFDPSKVMAHPTVTRFYQTLQTVN
ncbi:ATP-dependent DNA helicase pfh1 [Choanephora cucurbitarum]|uniref:ATP-dependent DNA helicase PIF1 n=1 Tax=Choanephora cucurbitarum TaxID=101091 RepID=A0A1C7NKC8_9FUNG|nr:ATP-dependent DNA helicase pfh1 [Choanephora cucurbitarum]